MADVAARAGVSLKTVSRVVNGEPRVASHTAMLVMDAVRELGFRSNHAAATLARGQSQSSIGLVIGAVADPFYSRLTSGVEQVARERGHFVLVSSSDEDPALERDITLGLAARQVAGLIVVPCASDQGYLSFELAAGLAMVFVDRPARGLAADCVLTDNETGAREGAEHLLRLGHRRIAFVGNDPAVYTSAQRLAGFRAAHADVRVVVDESLITLGPRDTAEAEQAVQALLTRADPPTAVFAQNNLITMGAWRALHARRAAVDLVGFDDFALADVLQPPVTVVAQDPIGLGRRAAQLLFDRLDHPDADVRLEVLPTTLLTRT